MCQDCYSHSTSLAVMECPPWNPTGGFQGIKIMETKSNTPVKPSESQRIRSHRHSPRNPQVHSDTWNYLALLSAKSLQVLSFHIILPSNIISSTPLWRGGGGVLPVHLLYMKSVQNYVSTEKGHQDAYMLGYRYKKHLEEQKLAA